MKNAGKACNNRLYRHIRTFEKIVKNYFVIYRKTQVQLETLTIPSLRVSAELFSGGSIHKIYIRQRIAQRSTRILRKRHTQ